MPWAGKCYKLPMLWNGKSVWKKFQSNQGYLFWDPSGGSEGTYFFGLKLADPMEPDWDGVTAWVEANYTTFGNVHVPWTSGMPTNWRVVSMTQCLAECNKHFEEQNIVLAREIEDLKELQKKKDKEMEGLQHSLDVTKQLEVATNMLEKEWQVDDPPTTAAASSSAAGWMAPTAKSMAQSPVSCLCTTSYYVVLASTGWIYSSHQGLVMSLSWRVSDYFYGCSMSHCWLLFGL